MNYILATCIVISNIITSFAFVGIANRLSRSIERHNYYKPTNNIQCNLHNNNANNANNANIDRRSVVKLIPIISIISLSKKSSATMESRPQSPLSQRRPRSVVVFGASGYTGGDTIRALLEKNISVVAVTRRKVDIVDREHAKLNTLVIDDLDKKNSITSVIADVINPDTLLGIMKDADAVIFCAASRPKVKVIATPGVDISKKTMKYTAANAANAAIAEPSDNVEDIGLVNVAEEAIRSNVKRLIIVSSICAKCQKNDDTSGNGYGEAIDRGFASCDACYKKQTGEERVRILYEKAPKHLSYTIVRPGMLSPGEKRGAKEVEFNQGISKSGIISRLDLADILVSASETDNSAKKTFEVYYKDTAQPVDMYKSLKTCKELGHSIKECFFGEGYNETEPLTMERIMKMPQTGSIFISGTEVLGNNYTDMLDKLQKDVYVPYDINVLRSNDIM
jgi:nucleoside-diphosphate-sugar epimerase